MRLLLFAVLAVLSVSAFAECMCNRSSSQNESMYSAQSRYYPNRANYVDSYANRASSCSRDPNGEGVTYYCGKKPANTQTEILWR